MDTIQILETNPDTNFKLKQQQLVKIIEQVSVRTILFNPKLQRDDEAALAFAQSQLAPCVKEHVSQTSHIPHYEFSHIYFPNLKKP